MTLSAKKPSNDNSEPPGISYLADADGWIVDCEPEAWASFATQNGADALASGVGLNVFASCSDTETATVYRQIHSLLLCHKLDSYSFNFRCDSPERHRLFRMTMIRYPEEDAVLYWSQLLMEGERAPITLLKRQAERSCVSFSAVKICSFCQHVWDSGLASWIEAEEHSARFDDKTRIAHGVCDQCHDLVVAPLIGVSAQG